MNLAIRRGHRAAETTEAAPTVRQRAPATLTLVRQRAQPTAESIVRLTVTAVFAYGLALVIPPTTPRPVLAPLSALLVVQVSAYQTLRSAVRRVSSVVAGVLLALGLSAWVGFTWWSLAIAIATGLAVGHALHLHEEMLDSTRLDGDDDPLSDPDVRRHMAGVLGELAAAVRTYGSLATEFDEPGHDLLESELERHLAAARDEQRRLSELPGRDPAARPAAWPLRGELISQLDRLREELEAGKPSHRVRPRRNRGLRSKYRVPQRLPPSWRRLIR